MIRFLLCYLGRLAAALESSTANQETEPIAVFEGSNRQNYIETDHARIDAAYA